MMNDNDAAGMTATAADSAGRVGALRGHYARGPAAAPAATGGDAPGVTLRELPGLRLLQVAAWHDTLAQAGEAAARAANVHIAPGPGQSAYRENGERAVLRVEPLKWWVLGEGGESAVAAAQLPAELGTTLDLSHSRTHLRIDGPFAAQFLNRHLPLDLREAAFPAGAVASSLLHHVGVTLWRAPAGYELFIPRGFALSVWEVLLQTAAQFDGEVV